MKTSASFTGFLLCLILGAACLATLNMKLLPELRKAEEGTAGMVYLGALVQAPAEEKGEQAPEVPPQEVPAGSEDAQAFAVPEAEAAADGNPVFPDVSEAHAASNLVESSVGSDRADEGGDGVDGEARTLELVLRFEAHGYELSPAHRRALTEALKSRTGTGPFRIEVDGHSDATGAAVIDNTLLSRLRAAAVADFLMAHGVPTEKITIGAHGSTRPVDSSPNPAAWEKNRRVEVRFLEDRS